MGRRTVAVLEAALLPAPNAREARAAVLLSIVKSQTASALETVCRRSGGRWGWSGGDAGSGGVVVDGSQSEAALAPS